MDPHISLREVQDNDREFLLRVYASTREEELAPVPWSDAEKDEFLRMQFHAQDTHYHSHFPQADYDVILLDGHRAGRLYVDRGPDEMRILDIALLAEHRGQGIGDGLMRGLLREAAETRRPVCIHVEYNNPAMHLYLRLGFTQVGETGVYYLMQWTPEAP